MASLRHRQKERRREAILRVAQSFFLAKGYDSTSIEEIAAEAEVSVPTLYRYFKSKTELLLGLQQLDLDQLAKLGQTVLADPPDDPVEALSDLILEQNSDMFDSVPGSPDLVLWRVVVSEAIRNPESLGRAYVVGDDILTRQLEILCNILQQRRQIRANVDLRKLAELMSLLAHAYFRLRLMGAEIGNDEIRAALRSHVAMIYKGIAPDPTERA